MNDDITDQQLLLWNRRGLVPGPEEGVEEFFFRVNFCLGFKDQIESQLEGSLPFSSEDLSSSKFLESVSDKTCFYYDIALDWVPLFFSDYKLSPWHGGCAWIFQLNEETPTSAFFQLRKAFYKKEKYLGIYHRDEVLVHECAHVGRMMFFEPKFEEMLAYKSAPSAFRRWLGPLVERAWESAIFALMLFLIILFDIFLLAMGYDRFYEQMLWLKLIPLSFIVAGIVRLYRRHWQFDHCLENLKVTLGDEKGARAVIYRLTDDEIILFGKSSDVILSYVEANKRRTLRWRLLHSAYFSLPSMNGV